MEAAFPDLGALAWFGAWAVAVAVLFFAGLRLPLQPRRARRTVVLYNIGALVLGTLLAVFANAALILHDAHLDLTREKVFTPSRQAMAVVDALQEPVRLTYFYSGLDQKLTGVIEPEIIQGLIA